MASSSSSSASLKSSVEKFDMSNTSMWTRFPGSFGMFGKASEHSDERSGTCQDTFEHVLGVVGTLESCSRDFTREQDRV